MPPRITHEQLKEELDPCFGIETIRSWYPKGKDAITPWEVLVESSTPTLNKLWMASKYLPASANHQFLEDCVYWVMSQLGDGSVPDDLLNDSSLVVKEVRKRAGQFYSDSFGRGIAVKDRVKEGDSNYTWTAMIMIKQAAPRQIREEFDDFCLKRLTEIAHEWKDVDYHISPSPVGGRGEVVSNSEHVAEILSEGSTNSVHLRER